VLCCAASAAADSPDHMPELIEPIGPIEPIIPQQEDLTPLGGGGGLLAAIGGSSDAADDPIAAIDAGVPALMDAPFGDVAAASSERRWELTDYAGRPLNESSEALDRRCQQAINEVMERERSQSAPPLYSDPLEGVQVAPKNSSAEVRVVYFIGVGPRPHAHVVVSRLLYALWSAVNLYLLHIDVKAGGEAVSECMRLDAQYPNVHVMRTRRLVQWGMFSMVSNYLDGIRSVLDAAKRGDFDFDFDFFINLSDADLALRTDAEVRAFLARIGPRTMVNVHEGGGPLLTEANAFIDAHTIVECGGYGFVAVNKTHTTFPMTAGCCIGRSGPVSFATLPLATHARLLEAERPVHTGSQWAVLARPFCEWLLDSPDAASLLLAYERRLVPDESLLQTAVMHSPFKASLLNHNLRWIDWPHQHGDAQAYWDKVGKGGRAFVGGPQVLNSSELGPVLSSPYMFARKVDMEIDANVLVMWDKWMARKLAGERPHPPQAPIGHSPGDPMLSVRFRAPGLRDLEAEAALAASGGRPRRRVARVDFADGSACGCGDGCHLLAGGCCDGADPFAVPLPSPRRGRGAGHGGGGGGGAGAGRAQAPPLHNASAALHRACAHAAQPPTTSGGEGAPPCPAPGGVETASKPGGAKVVLSWLNKAPHPVRLSVLDYRGAELGMATMRKPGESLAYSSNENVVWRARALNGELLLEYVPRGADGQTVVVEPCRFAHLGAASTLLPNLDAERALQAQRARGRP